MNRFKIAISIIGVVQVMVATALASQAVQPPIYSLAPVVAFGLVIVNAGLVFLSAQMPSWESSGDAANAVNTSEKA